MTFLYAYPFIVKHFWIKLGWVRFASVPRNVPWGFLLIKRAHSFGTKPPCKEIRGYCDHAESTEGKNDLRVEKKLPQNYVQRYVTSMRRRCLAVVNSAGRHGHGRRCRIIYLRILWYFLCFVIYSIKFGLWKNVNFDFTINLNFAFAFFNFLFSSK